MNLKNIMKRAHAIARTMEGHYQARLSFGLTRAWAEYTLANENFTGEDIIVSLVKQYLSIVRDRQEQRRQRITNRVMNTVSWNPRGLRYAV